MRALPLLLAGCVARGVVGDTGLADTSERDPGDSAAVGDTDTGEAPPPRCVETSGHVVCTHHVLVLRPSDTDLREVEFQVPTGTPPAAGWPAVVLFSGSLLSAERSWDAREGEPFGLYHQARVVAALLEAGYAVITPETRGDGLTWWDTNIPPYNVDWRSAPDDALMRRLLEAVDGGRFGPLDPGRLFAGGLSSGGYMASRVGLAYPGRFRAIVVQSASYMTCAGAACAIPELPSDHPPALLLSGDEDAIVPAWTTALYEERLRAAGVEVESHVVRGAGHEWTAGAPAWTVAFLTDRRSR